MVRNLHACFQAVCEILLHSGGRLAAKLILTVVQKFTTARPRRTRTSGGAVDDRVAVEGGIILKCGFWLHGLS